MRASHGSTRPRHLDKLGTLCHQGMDIASFLFQVPDDEAGRNRLAAIVEAIGQEEAVNGRHEFPAILDDMREALAGPANSMSAEKLNDGFERMVKLWHASHNDPF